MAVGALALTTVGAIFGLGKEDKGPDFDIGNHGGDVHRVVEVDEAEDAFRGAGVDEATRTEIAGNFDTAEQFFDNISTEEGAENFQNMEEAVEAKVDALKKEYGSTVSESTLRQWAEEEVRLTFQAAERDAARKAVGGAK